MAEAQVSLGSIHSQDVTVIRTLPTVLETPRGLGESQRGLGGGGPGLAADDLPGPVVTFLNVLGIDWPYLNEDQIRQFATMVRAFGQAVEQTHQDATNTIRNVTQAYQGTSTEALRSGWERLSATHVTEIVDGCHILADALEVGADVIVAQKAEAVIQLGIMAGEFIADQAASFVTFGLAEAGAPLIIEAGKLLVNTLKQQIIQMIVGDVVEAAAKPLFAKVEQMMAGLDWSNAPAAGSGAGSGFSIEFAEARGHTALLRTHAETMRGHAQTLNSGLEGLTF
jgi:uncharacterized protein YukE